MFRLQTEQCEPVLPYTHRQTGTGTEDMGCCQIYLQQHVYITGSLSTTPISGVLTASTCTLIAMGADICYRPCLPAKLFLMYVLEHRHAWSWGWTCTHTVLGHAKAHKILYYNTVNSSRVYTCTVQDTKVYILPPVCRCIWVHIEYTVTQTHKSVFGSPHIYTVYILYTEPCMWKLGSCACSMWLARTESQSLHKSVSDLTVKRWEWNQAQYAWISFTVLTMSSVLYVPINIATVQCTYMYKWYTGIWCQSIKSQQQLEVWKKQWKCYLYSTQ